MWPLADPADRDGMRILVVEDEERLAGLLRRGLSEAGHAVDVTGSGAYLSSKSIAATLWKVSSSYFRTNCIMPST